MVSLLNLRRRTTVGDAGWAQIRALAYSKFSTRKISKLCQCSRSTVFNALKQAIPPSERVAQRGPMNPRVARLLVGRRLKVKKLIAKRHTATGSKIVKQRGRPRKDGTKRPQWTVTRKSEKLSFPSPASVARQLTLDGTAVSASTIRRDLTVLGFVCYRRPRVQRVCADDFENRLQFCRWLLRKPKSYTDNIVWTDEKWCDSNDAGCMFQWAPKGERGLLIPRETEQFPPKIFIWGAIWVGGRHLVVVQLKDGAMDHTEYIHQCVNGNFLRKIKKRALMQDGAPVHWHEAVREHLMKCKVNILPNFPAHSCDLNPIENMWSLLQKQISDRGPWGPEDLASFAVEEWNKISQDIIDSLCLSIRGRCRDCISKKGAATGK